MPSRISAYLHRLSLEYARADEKVLISVVQSARWSLVEGVEFDSWNGGQHGHNLIFYLQPELLAKIPLSSQPDLGERMRIDINAASASIENEYIKKVFFDIDAEASDARPTSEMPAFWKPGFLRVFVSHRDTHKRDAKALAEELEEYGISSFVAHETIEPDSEWLVEINKALSTMEVMLALVTDDFHDSVWTNQEIGFALGRGVPVISTKLGKSDPRGFIQSRQALKISSDDVRGAAIELFNRLSIKVGAADRLRGHLVSALCASTSYLQACRRFDRLTDIEGFTRQDANQIIRAFSANSQLYHCNYLLSKNRLTRFLQSCTGERYTIAGNRITEELPF